MKRWLLCLGMMVAACQNSAADVEWFTDLPSALVKAKAENKTVLLDFTGSDWCGWCKKLKGEVFDQPDFGQFAQANLVMVEVDFPRQKFISSAQRAANDQLARKYDVQGYPTIILLNSSGTKVGESGYVAGGAAHYIADLEGKVPGMKHWTPPAAAPDTREILHGRPEPAFVPITPSVPTHYGELALKGISGAKDRRLALINNQTLMAGETGKVKVHDGHVDVTCKAIYNESVLVLVEGKEMELKLSAH